MTREKKKRLKEALLQKKETAATPREAGAIQKNLVAIEDAHPRRPRCAYFGELIQMDASSFEWVCGQIWHLHVAVDDATGRMVRYPRDTGRLLPCVPPDPHSLWNSIQVLH